MHQQSKNSVNVYIGKMQSLFPEIENFSLNVSSSARMLLQILDTKLICQKLGKTSLDVEMDVVHGGPRRICSDMIKTMA